MWSSPTYGPTPPFYENMESNLPTHSQQRTCCCSHPLVPQPTQTGHRDQKPKPDPHNYRGIGLGDKLGMIYQLGLQSELLDHTLKHDLLTSAQGACQANRQPFDTVYTLIEFITSRDQVQNQPTFVFFGDIALAFPTVNRQILLVRLHTTGVPPKL